ncbi:MAG: ASKHA domain-containing protein [Halodesulfurarchaeum sp.]
MTFEPWGIEATSRTEETLLELAEREGVEIQALCGGDGVCGTCRVQVEAGGENLSSVTEAERSILGEDALEAGVRLGCEARILEGSVEVFVPPKSRLDQGVIMTEGRAMDFERRPAARPYPLRLDAPSLEDTQADRERVLDGLAAEYDLEVDSVDRRGLQELPNRIRAAGDRETLRVTPIVFRERELRTVFPGQQAEIYGIAVDVGTTTLACYLANLVTGEICATTSRLNPQRPHGGDIVSRVEFAQRGPEERATLHREVATAVAEMIEEVTETAGVDPSTIMDAVFVGNTAMHHCFLEIESTYVTVSPYIPAAHGLLEYDARDLDVPINESGTAAWLPIIGGWVGPDFVADLLAANVFEREGTTVYIDIGTNGEIGVSTDDQLLAASAPAGPALEGAEITDGVQAKQGAIERVSLDAETWEPELGVIGGTSPVGICGSGLLDAVAALFEVGAISRRGRLAEPAASPRIRDGPDEERMFVLVEEANTGHGEEIVISQMDIREIQHAKAAIQTGTTLLLEEAGVDTVDQLVMAGGFGNSIDPGAASLLGLFPETRVEAVDFLGNAAGYGAIYALLDETARETATEIIERVEYVELATLDRFNDEFMESMFLPHRDLERYPSVKRRLEKVRGSLADF